MRRKYNPKISCSLTRIGSFDILEELEKTKSEIASIFSPINSQCSSPLMSPTRKPTRIKENNFEKLPPISVHRNPMSMISGREINYEWKKKYKPKNKTRLKQWAVTRSIIDRNINLDRAESYLENHGIRFSHYYSHSGLPD